MSIVAGTIVALSAVLGFALTLLTLPGLWLTLLVAVACWWWMGSAFYSPWTVGVALGLGVLAEVADLAASAAGTTRVGGGRAGALGSIAGALIGAIAGSFVMPVIGTIAGGVIGAGAGALIGERGVSAKPWRDSARIAGGAMTGKVVAMFVKIALAGAIGVILTAGAFVP